jgi:hypothetical protein
MVGVGRERGQGLAALVNRAEDPCSNTQRALTRPKPVMQALWRVNQVNAHAALHSPSSAEGSSVCSVSRTNSLQPLLHTQSPTQ